MEFSQTGFQLGEENLDRSQFPQYSSKNSSSNCQVNYRESHLKEKIKNKKIKKKRNKKSSDVDAIIYVSETYLYFNYFLMIGEVISLAVLNHLPALRNLLLRPNLGI